MRCIPTFVAVCCLLLIALRRCEAQNNMVPNSGFEDTDSCTFGLGLGALHHWYSAYGTPDHLQNCQPYGSANGLPLNIFTYQQPFEGNSCAGIFTFDGHSGTEYREWLMVPLLDTLEPGLTYYCSFRANAAFSGNGVNPQNWLASDHLGMLFTTYDRQWNWGDPQPAALNHAHVLYPQILSDTAGWTFVSGSFVADSAYAYVMIGNFFSNALTDTLHFASSVPEWGRYSYVLVDAVCVSPSLEGCELNQGADETYHPAAFVFPNPANDVLVINNAAGHDAMILDMLGQRVWSDRINNDRLVVDGGSWARGAYVLQVQGARGAQTVKFLLTDL